MYIYVYIMHYVTEREKRSVRRQRLGVSHFLATKWSYSSNDTRARLRGGGKKKKKKEKQICIILSRLRSGEIMRANPEYFS